MDDQLKHQLQMHIITEDEKTKRWRASWKWGSIASCGLFAVPVSYFWAGKVTVAKIDLRAAADINQGSTAELALAKQVSNGCTGLVEFALAHINWSIVTVAFVIVVASVLHARNQRRVSQDVVERYHPYRVEYEQGIDPKRTTSGLTTRGETPPEEK